MAVRIKKELMDSAFEKLMKEPPKVTKDISFTAINTEPEKKPQKQSIMKEPEKYMSLVEKSMKQITTVDCYDMIPSPDTWNIFPAYSEDKMLELMFSIMKNGILMPVILWEQKNGEKMILAGHNRRTAILRLIDEYGSQLMSDGKPYRDFIRNVPCIVYKNDELTESDARLIIIDTNYVQRDNTPELRVKIIKDRMELTKNVTDKKGNSIGEMAEKLGLQKSAIYEDYTIGTKLIPALQKIYYDGDITKKAVLKIATLPEHLQEHLAKTPDRISTKAAMKIKKMKYNVDTLDALFSGDVKEEYVYISFSVPADKASEIKDRCREIIVEYLQ